MESKRRELLIIFYRNPQRGKVKTRLAATIGDQNALDVYLELCHHAKEVSETLKVSKVVFYTEKVDRNDIWPDHIYQKRLQEGADLGTRMRNAFAWGFGSGFESICIIGTDCYDLTRNNLEQAFSALLTNEVVIGPAVDGGYYLLGMRRLHNNLFIGKQWSTESVFADTVKDLVADGVSYRELPLLNDVDVEADIPAELRRKLARLS